ncbi:MAG: response regulator, partial [Oscillospiraceae bacterium]
MRRILVVEDENSIREMIALNLNIANFEVVEADSAEAALEILQTDKKSFEVAILDVMLLDKIFLRLQEAV